MWLGENHVVVAIGIGLAGTNHRSATVGDGDRAAWLGGADDLGAARDQADGRLVRRGAVNGKVKRSGRGAGVARQIGLRQGDAVRAIRERGRWGKAPFAIFPHRGLAHGLTVVIDRDGAAHLAGAGQGRAVGIGGLPGGKHALHRPGGVSDRHAGRGIRGNGVHVKAECR